MALLQAVRSLAMRTLKQGSIIISHSTLPSAVRYPCREQIAKGMPWIPSHAASFSSMASESEFEEEKSTFIADKTFTEEELLQVVSRIEANKVQSADDGTMPFKIADDSGDEFSYSYPKLSDHRINLIGYFGNETIQIEFYLVGRANGRDCIHLEVTLVNGSDITFFCGGYADEFSIDSVDYSFSSADVCDLHPSLQKRLMDILEMRGVKPSLLIFLCQQIKDRYTKNTNKGKRKNTKL